MKKKIKIITIIFIICAILFNFTNFLSVYLNFIGNISFNKHYHGLAKTYYKKALDYNSNENILYNLGNIEYKADDLGKAFEFYNKINKTINNTLSINTNYNLGNLYYKTGDKEFDIFKKIQFWKKSLESYNKVLSKKNDIETLENYYFVKKKLDELMKQNKQQKNEEKKKDEEKQNENNSQKKNEKKDKKPSNNSKNDEKNNENQNNSPKNDDQNISVQNGRPDEYKLNKGQNLNELSEEEKNELEKYYNSLKQDQKENSNYFGKENLNGNNINNDLFDSLFQDQFFTKDFQNFDHSIINNEKDW